MKIMIKGNSSKRTTIFTIKIHQLHHEISSFYNSQNLFLISLQFIYQIIHLPLIIYLFIKLPSNPWTSKPYPKSSSSTKKTKKCKIAESESKSSMTPPDQIQSRKPPKKSTTPSHSQNNSPQIYKSTHLPTPTSLASLSLAYKIKYSSLTQTISKASLPLQTPQPNL